MIPIVTMGVMRAMVTPTFRFVHKYLWRTFIVLLIVVVLLGVCFLYWLYQSEKPRKIADIPGPVGSDTKYELWYAKGGDLTFRPTIGNPIIRYYDYYDDVNVARIQWLSDDRVLVTMANGTTVDIRVGFDIKYKQINHDASDMSR